MCTFFGEVLPVISRAVEDDDDEDQDCPPETYGILRPNVITILIRGCVDKRRLFLMASSVCVRAIMRVFVILCLPPETGREVARSILVRCTFFFLFSLLHA